MLGMKSLVTLTLLGAGALSLGACAAPTTPDDTSEVASPIQNGGKDGKDGKDRMGGKDDDEDCSGPVVLARGPGAKEDCEVHKHERKRDRDRKHDRKDDCGRDDKGDCRPPPPPPPPPKDDCDDHDGKTW
jgi:hypothetical protein